MVLSAALDKGLVFLSLIAIFTSVIGAVYYLNIVKEMFFSLPDYMVNTMLENLVLKGNILFRWGPRPKKKIYKTRIKNIHFKYNNAVISSPIAFVISNITLIILLFIFMNREWLSMGKQKLMWFLNKLNLIYNKYIRYFYFITTYSTIFINNYTTKTKDLASHAVLASANQNNINPWFITGFTDAEGSFMIHLEKNKDKWRVRPTFQIKLNIKDLSLLEMIKIYFNHVVGSAPQLIYLAKNVFIK